MTAGTSAAPGPRWAGSRSALVEVIRDEILAAPGRRITFARFMERALTEPGLGYYATSQLRPTRAGDFLSAPELHPFFGRCLARFMAAAWHAAGEPDRYLVREYGAGRGRLRDDVLAGLAAEGSPLAARVAWQALDLPGWRSTAGHDALRSTAGRPPPSSVDDVGTPGPAGPAPPGPPDADEPADLVLANEYLDALPVHRLVQASDALQEAWVGWRDDWFVEVLDSPSDPALAALLAADGVVLRDRQRADVCLAAPAWVREVAAHLASGGLLLVIDYGHEAPELHGPRRLAGSLLTYREHRVADAPFEAVGETDITAHVDLTALRRAASAAGLSLVGHTTQARFLAGLGLGELLATLGREPGADMGAYLEARGAVVRLVDPRHLGAFAVLAWRRREGATSGMGNETVGEEPAGLDLRGFEPSRSGLPGFEPA